MYIWELPPDRFKDPELIGQSSEGCVYKAFDNHFQTDVVVKRLNSMYWDKNFEYRLIRQIKSLRRLEHPSIIKYLEFFTVEEGKATWVVYKYHPGEPLLDLMDRFPRGMPENYALLLFKQILKGIEYSHSKGVIHRDLKATNILVNRNDDSVVIIDFGLATTVEERGETMDISAGTPYYMSPEQFLSLKETDELTDIWALGCLLQQLLTNTLPFGSPPEQPMVVFDRVQSRPPNIPSKINEDMQMIISYSLEKMKRMRMKSATEFLKLIAMYESQRR